MARSLPWRILAALLLLPVAAPIVAHAAPAATTAALAGVYELQGVMEVGSGLRLTTDGRFDYFLAYGALDETGAGTWTVDGNRVLLTSDGPLTPPRFTLKSTAKTPDPTLTVHVVGPNGQPLENFDVAILFDRGEPEVGNTTRDGYTVPLPTNRRITSIRLGIAVYDLASDPFAVDTAKANVVTFSFQPNDIGKVDFKAMPLVIEDDALVMTRNGTRMRYVRVDSAH